MKRTIVINTSRNYGVALSHLLQSLAMSGGSKAHDCRLIACVTGVPAEESAEVSQDIRGRHPQLDVVLTHPSNLWEYTAFVAVGRALRAGTVLHYDADAIYFMLHDTTEAGPRFWPSFAATCDRIEAMTVRQRAHAADPERPRAVEVVTSNPAARAGLRLEQPDEVPDGLFIVDKRTGMRYTARGDRLIMRPALRTPLPGVVFHQQLFELEDIADPCGATVRSVSQPTMRLSVDPDTDQLCLSQDPERWMRFSHPCVIETVADRLEEHVRNRETLDWFPVCDNYNIGFATAAFLHDVCADLYAGVTMDKTMAIAIETQPRHHLSLKRNARAWTYADPKRHHNLCNHNNDTDVYGTGVLRAVSYLNSLDLKKFLCFWHPKGPGHPNAV